jgi:hypothetical protein
MYSTWACIGSLIVLIIGHSGGASVPGWTISGKEVGCQRCGEWVELDTASGEIQSFGNSSKLYRGVRRVSLIPKSNEGSGHNSEKFWILMRSRIFGAKLSCSMVASLCLEINLESSFSGGMVYFCRYSGAVVVLYPRSRQVQPFNDMLGSPEINPFSKSSVSILTQDFLSPRFGSKEQPQ